MAEKLREYEAKRKFDKTPEPRASDGDRTEAQGSFVVQEHHARRLHWDLRMEHEGTLLSWALPRGVPQLQQPNRMAVRTEDHPLEYLDFEGEIPEGQYGAGQMKIWDRGTFVAEKIAPEKVVATFDGERMNGRYALFRTRGKDWLIHRMDPPLDPEREPMPDDLRPMLPKRGRIPRREEDYGFEIAWSGLRTLVWCEPGHIRKTVARGEGDVVERFPELRRLARAMGSREAIIDGELVVFGKDGRPSPDRLRQRKGASSDSIARRLSSRLPATFVIFDLPFFEGHSLLDAPYQDRRDALENLDLEDERWQTPPYHRGEGRELLEAVRRRRLPGLVAKRLDSSYEPGRRSESWIKVEA